MRDKEPYREVCCQKCAMTREERIVYPDGCPMRFPEHGCPFYDPPALPSERFRAMTSRLSALAQWLDNRFELPGCGYRQYIEAAAALREAEAVLREWRATELDPMDEEFEPWLEQFTARVDALLSDSGGDHWQPDKTASA